MSDSERSDWLAAAEAAGAAETLQIRIRRLPLPLLPLPHLPQVPRLGLDCWSHRLDHDLTLPLQDLRLQSLRHLGLRLHFYSRVG